MRKFAIVGLLAVVTLGINALTAPLTAVAQVCVQCPVIEEPRCPTCYELIPGDCYHCASCKKIPHCGH